MNKRLINHFAAYFTRLCGLTIHAVPRKQFFLVILRNVDQKQMIIWNLFLKTPVFKELNDIIQPITATQESVPKLRNREEMFPRYYMNSDIISKTSTTHWRVTRCEDVKQDYI